MIVYSQVPRPSGGAPDPLSYLQELYQLIPEEHLGTIRATRGEGSPEETGGPVYYLAWGEEGSRTRRPDLLSVRRGNREPRGCPRPRRTLYT